MKGQDTTPQDMFVGVRNTLRGNAFKPIASIRNYQSFYHLNDPILDLSTTENQLLNRAYSHVPELGFTTKAIEKASKEMGLNSNSSNALFNFTSDSKNFQMELVLFHLKKCRNDLDLIRKSESFKEKFQGKSETDKLRFLLNSRLSMNLPIINHLPNALGLMILPNNFKTSLTELHNLSDDITFYSGDRSVDFKWYSKRFSISTLYIQSELFMLNDKSEGCNDTIKFVDERLNEVEKAGYIYNSVEEWLFFNAVSIVNIVKSQLARG